MNAYALGLRGDRAAAALTLIVLPALYVTRESDHTHLEESTT